MLEQLVQVLLLSAAVSTGTLLVTRSSLFKPIRAMMSRWIFTEELFTCPLCMSVWLAMIASFFSPLLYVTQYMFINYWITVLVTVAIAAPIMAKMFKSIASLTVEE